MAAEQPSCSCYCTTCCSYSSPQSCISRQWVSCNSNSCESQKAAAARAERPCPQAVHVQDAHCAAGCVQTCCADASGVEAAGNEPSATNVPHGEAAGRVQGKVRFWFRTLEHVHNHCCVDQDSQCMLILGKCAGRNPYYCQQPKTTALHALQSLASLSQQVAHHLEEIGHLCFRYQ